MKRRNGSDMRVMREIRFSLAATLDSPVTNSWAGWPSATGIQPYLTLQATVSGPVDSRSGYLVNIARIDELLRSRSIPLAMNLAATGASGGAPAAGESLIVAIATDLLNHPPPGTSWCGWSLRPTPFLSYAVEATDVNTIHLSQRFEFSAAHRLHCSDMSDEENRRYFGKCNNPNGHGHNYQLEVTVSGTADSRTGRIMPLVEFEQIVKEAVIDRFDHKHLNQDCAEFADLNPSVENITQVIWSILDGRLAPAHLSRVRVWETPKTWAEYGGPEA